MFFVANHDEDCGFNRAEDLSMFMSFIHIFQLHFSLNIQIASHYLFLT